MMPVLVIGEPKAIVRAVQRCENSLNVGAICNVEFGATWATQGTRQYKVDGQWFACRVLRHDSATVVVELLPDVRLASAPCVCDENGMVCENHPSIAYGQCYCGGAGMPCIKPECPWRLPS